jgi:hypothetical protein
LQVEGLFPSYVHVNMHGFPPLRELRRAFRFYDSNAFVTLWIANVLLDGVRIGAWSSAQVPDHVLKSSVKTLVNVFHDHNMDVCVPAVNFWTGTLVNDTWVSQPTNLAQPLLEMESFGNVLHAFLNATHTDFLWPYVRDVTELFPDFLLGAFGIPADADDSSVNLALGEALLQLQELYPESAGLWTDSANANPAGLFALLTKFV